MIYAGVVTSATLPRRVRDAVSIFRLSQTLHLYIAYFVMSVTRRGRYNSILYIPWRWDVSRNIQNRVCNIRDNLILYSLYCDASQTLQKRRGITHNLPFNRPIMPISCCETADTATACWWPHWDLSNSISVIKIWEGHRQNESWPLFLRTAQITL